MAAFFVFWNAGECRHYEALYDWQGKKTPLLRASHLPSGVSDKPFRFPGGFAPNVQDNNEVRVGFFFLMTCRSLLWVVAATLLVWLGIGWLIDPLIKLIAWLFMYPFSSCGFFFGGSNVYR